MLDSQPSLGVSLVWASSLLIADSESTKSLETYNRFRVCPRTACWNPRSIRSLQLDRTYSVISSSINVHPLLFGIQPPYRTLGSQERKSALMKRKRCQGTQQSVTSAGCVPLPPQHMSNETRVERVEFYRSRSLAGFRLANSPKLRAASPARWICFKHTL